MVSFENHFTEFCENWLSNFVRDPAN